MDHAEALPPSDSRRDAAAFGELADLDPVALARHGRAMRALARGLLGREDAADDAVQEAWLHVLGRGRSAGSALRLDQRLRWLVTRFARDGRRSERSRAERERRVAEERESAEPIDRGVEAGEVVAAALAKLPREWRDCLWMRFYEDLAPREIAARLGVPLETVRSRLRRGLEALREDVERRLAARGLGMSLLLPLAGLESGSLPVPGPFPVGSPLGTALALSMNKSVVAVSALALAFAGLWSFGPLTAAGPDDPADSAVASVDLDPAPAETPEALGTGDEIVRAASDVARPARTSERAQVEPDVVALPTARISAVDDAARDPVPFLELATSWEGGEVVLTTDVNGVATLPADTARSLRVEWDAAQSDSQDGWFGSFGFEEAFEGRVENVFGDQVADGEVRWSSGRVGREGRDWERPESGPDAELPLVVDVGPTWILDVKLPGGGVLPLEDGMHAQFVDEEGVLASADVAVTEGLRWVRFTGMIAPSDGETEIVLRSDDGAWTGRATVARSAGFERRPLVVVLEERGVIEGHVRAASGEPFENVVVHVQYPGGETFSSPPSTEDGSFAIGWLEPGDATVFVNDPFYGPFQVPVYVPGGERSRVDVVIERLEGGGIVEGVIESTSGEFDGDVFLFLEGGHDLDYWARSDPKFEERDGRLVARFAFHDVPPGELSLVCNTTAPYAVRANARTLRAPISDVVFVVDDGVRPLEVRARALGTDGAPLEGFTLQYAINGQYRDWTGGNAETPARVDVPPGVAFEWAMFAPGYAPASGDELALDGEVLDVTLRPGWGARINLLSIETLSGLPDVEVFADGVSVGRTGTDGELLVVLERRPERISFDPDRWRLYSDATYRSELDPETGAVLAEDGSGYVSAYLRPAR